MKNKAITKLGLWLLVLGIGILFFHLYPQKWWFATFIKEVYANVSCELISISITILLIDYLYEKKAIENNKRRLIRELGSEDKGFTSRALKEIKELGYLSDGTLNNSDLSKANLEGLDFSGGVLKNVNFEHAILNKTTFKDADLSNSILDNADLRESNFENCTLIHVHMKHCNLYSSNLNRCNISESDLLKANFEQAEMIDAVIINTKLEDSSIRLANLTRSKFNNCNFSNSDINGSNLKDTKFERCELQGVLGWGNTTDFKQNNFSACLNLPTF